MACPLPFIGRAAPTPTTPTSRSAAKPLSAVPPPLRRPAYADCASCAVLCRTQDPITPITQLDGDVVQDYTGRNYVVMNNWLPDKSMLFDVREAAPSTPACLVAPRDDQHLLSSFQRAHRCRPAALPAADRPTHPREIRPCAQVYDLKGSADDKMMVRDPTHKDYNPTRWP